LLRGAGQLHAGASRTWKKEADNGLNGLGGGDSDDGKLDASPPPASVDVVALKNYLDVWNAVATNKRQRIGQAKAAAGAAAAGTPRKESRDDEAGVLAVLVRASLDESFHGGQG